MLCVQELERQTDPLIIIGHQGILRVLYSYLTGKPREEAPRAILGHDAMSRYADLQCAAGVVLVLCIISIVSHASSYTRFQS